MKKTAAAKQGVVVLIGQNVSSIGTNLGSLKVVPNKAKKTVDPAALPDLDAMSVVVETPEQIEARVADAKKLRAYAQKAAGTIMTIRERCAQIRAIEIRVGDLTYELQKELDKHLVNEDRILSANGDEAMQERIRFALLMEEVKAAPITRETAAALLAQCVDMGRFRLATEKDSPHFRADKIGPQEFNGLVYAPLLDSRKDSGQYALEAELGKYLAKVGEVIAQEEKARAEESLQAGDPRLDRFADGVVGTYVLRFPERNSIGKLALPTGAGLVSIEKKSRWGGGEMTIIKIVSGAGRLAWMSDYRGSWISFGSFKRGLSGANLEDGLRLMSDRLIRTLADAIKLWKNSDRR